jgi:hypothetical protein
MPIIDQKNYKIQVFPTKSTLMRINENPYNRNDSSHLDFPSHLIELALPNKMREKISY